ncbi:MAG: sigma 54-interacting transcriptional regulator [Hyphomicrobiales bacterium]|nr:sigma 54-interacting transcriptional regulator [Hyphomicrobiales bacterium]
MHAAVTELSILLLQGETGAGKQLVARIVHCNSMGAHFAGRLPKG